jgi:hypothetical protein
LFQQGVENNAMNMDGGFADEEPLDLIFIRTLQGINMRRPHNSTRWSRDSRLSEKAPDAP